MLKGLKVKELQSSLKVPLEDFLSAHFHSGKTFRDIAAILNVPQHTCYKWMKQLNLVRDKRQANKLGWLKGKWSKEKLIERITGNTYSRGCTPPNKGKRMSQEIRDKISAAQIGRRLGPQHHWWKGGISATNYGSGWKSAKRIILQRAQGICEYCHQRPSYSRALDVHHKIPYKKCSDSQTAHCIDNLIAVCRKCHKLLEYQEDNP